MINLMNLVIILLCGSKKGLLQCLIHSQSTTTETSSSSFPTCAKKLILLWAEIFSFLFPRKCLYTFSCLKEKAHKKYSHGSPLFLPKCHQHCWLTLQQRHIPNLIHFAAVSNRNPRLPLPSSWTVSFWA